MEKTTGFILTALAKIQSELKAPKNQYNDFGKYKYRSCEDILEGVKPLLKTTGTVLTLSDEMVFMGDRYYVKATAILRNDTQEAMTIAYAREPLERKGMDSSQITGTASSYARKYALNGLFCIDDTKDADTQDNTVETVVRAVGGTVVKDDRDKVTAPGPQQSTNPLLISENQRRRLYAIRMGSGIPEDILNDHLKVNYNIESDYAIKKDWYEKICNFAQNYKVEEK